MTNIFDREPEQRRARPIVVEVALDADDQLSALRQLAPLPSGARIVGIIGPSGGRLSDERLQELLASPALGWSPPGRRQGA